MKLKESVDIDVLKMYGFQLVEHNRETGFKRYRKYYGILLATVCNKQMEKTMHLTLDAHPEDIIAGKHLISSVHQLNQDVASMTAKQLLELDEIPYTKAEINDWDAQIRANNPFRFLVE